MTDIFVPTDPGDLTLETLNSLLRKEVPDVAFDRFRVSESHTVGLGQASSAGRICLQVDYADGAPADLPSNIVLKVVKAGLGNPQRPDPIAGAAGALYRNELNIYRHVNPSGFWNPRGSSAAPMMAAPMRCQSASKRDPRSASNRDPLGDSAVC